MPNEDGSVKRKDTLQNVLHNESSGVSLIALVITIMVLIILAGIAMYVSTDSIDETARSAFIQELRDVEIHVASTRIQNQAEGTEEWIKNKNFYKVNIQNPPVDFVSFSDESVYGYVVDLENIEYNDTKYGKAYQNYSDGSEVKTVVFGRDDVYVYDAEGKIFYVKGFEVDDGIYYTAQDLVRVGPKIASIEKTLNTDDDNKSVTLRIGVSASKGGDLSATVEKKSATKVETTDDISYFTIVVRENKVYRILATEENVGTVSGTVSVSEIEAKVYTVTYDANVPSDKQLSDVQNMPMDGIKTENVPMTLSENIPILDGYRFLGWSSTQNALQATYRAEGEYLIDGNSTLYAVWQKNVAKTWTLIYSANGGIGEPAAVQDIEDSTFVSNSVPVRTGYGFAGWSTDPKATVAQYHAGDTITSNVAKDNIVLYAVWDISRRGVSVSIYPEGAGTVSGVGTKDVGSTVSLTATANAGCLFRGWSVTAGNVSLSNTMSSVTTFKMPDADVVLTANFEVSTVEIKYDGNKGVNVPAPQTVDYGTSITITNMVPVRSGYDFLGWSLSASDTAPTYAAGGSYTAITNTTFYAIWGEHVNTYTVTYDLDGGTGNFPPQVKTQRVALTLYNDRVPVKDGFTHLGWALSKGSSEVAYHAGDLYEKDQNITLYAVWKDNQSPDITLTASQSGDELVLTAVAHDDGTIIGYAWTTTSDTPTGWSASGTGEKDITVNKVIKQNGTHYIYMKDSAGNISNKSIRTYRVTYNFNGGTNGPSTQYKARGTGLRISSIVPVRDGYKFLGWSKAQRPGNTAASVNYAAGATETEENDLDLVAVWGETGFTLNKEIINTAIGESATTVTVTKSANTGTITVQSADTSIAVATISGTTITVTPVGTKTGTTKITVKESASGYEKDITVVVEKGERTISLSNASKTFAYGESAFVTNFTYTGGTSSTSVTTLDSEVANATISGTSVTITPKNFGTTGIRVRVHENDLYKEKTADITVNVTQKEIIITPDAGQKKVFDGTANTPTLTYTYIGAITGETPGFTGALTRDANPNVGQYEIGLGTLELQDNGTFKKANYKIKLSSTKVYFEITPKPYAFPTMITSHTYDGSIKYVAEAGDYYVRSGDYAQINAGTYTAEIWLSRPNDYIWSDTNSNAARNVTWTIEPKEITSDVEIDDIAEFGYTGGEIKPTLTVRNTELNTLLQKGRDYTVTYSNNVAAGTATATVTGIGNYTGTITKNFTISNATMTVEQEGFSGTYDGRSHGINIKVTTPASGATIYYATTPLTASNYNTAGSTTLPVFQNVTSTTVYYYIVAPSYKDYTNSKNVIIRERTVIGNIDVTGIASKNFTGSELTQNMIVKDTGLNRTLTSPTEYTVTYRNNIYPGTATVSITGAGNYTGSVSKTFTISGDIITITKSTESLATTFTVTLTHTLAAPTLQYRLNNGAWMTYNGPITVSEDCVVYARSIYNDVTIGSASLDVNNVCEHSYTPVTCTEDSVCIYCGLLREARLGHDFSTQLTTNTYLKSAATCTNPAEYYYKCSRCAEHGTSTYTYGTATGHDFSAKVMTQTYKRLDATCSDPETYYYKCSKCTAKGDTWYYNGTALGHNMGSWVTTKVATCTETGLKQRTCSRGCGYVETDIIPALGHDFTSKTMSEAYLKTAETCTTPATYYYKCSRCIQAGTETFTGDAPIGHDFSIRSISNEYRKSEATCTTPAEYYYKCSRCDEHGTATYTYGNALGHNFAEKKETSTYLAVAATCTTPNMYYYKCTRCNEHGTTTYPSGTELGHNYGTWTVAVAATCTEVGTEKSTCSRCGDIRTRSISALGHTAAAGWQTSPQDHWHLCSRCSTVIDKTPHSFGVSDGVYTCTVCGYKGYQLTLTGTHGEEAGAGRYQNGASVTITATPSTGYTFDKWQITSGSISGFSTTSATTTFTMPTQNVTIEAIYKPITYTITYTLNGGDITGNPTTYTIEDNFGLVNPTKMGYDFVGWSGTGIDGKSMNVIIRDEVGNKSFTANYVAWSGDVGSLVRAGKVKVGDYIDYEKFIDTSKSYKALATDTGYSSDRTLSADNSKKWRVLYANQTTGEVWITPYGAVNYDTSSQRLGLSGLKGYYNGASIIEAACNTLYTTGKGIAHSVTVEDIDKATGYDKTTFKHTINNVDYKVGDTIQYTSGEYWIKTQKDKNGNIGNNGVSGGVAGSEWISGVTRYTASSTNPVIATQTYYYYNPSSSSNVITAMAGTVLGSGYGWMASPCVAMGPSVPAYVLHVATSSNVNSMALTAPDNSTGGGAFGIRPLVILDSALKISNTEQASSENMVYWSMEN